MNKAEAVNIVRNQDAKDAHMAALRIERILESMKIECQQEGHGYYMCMSNSWREAHGEFQEMAKRYRARHELLK